jgi:hypothetical protein
MARSSHGPYTGPEDDRDQDLWSAQRGTTRVVVAFAASVVTLSTELDG